VDVDKVGVLVGVSGAIETWVSIVLV